MINALRTFINFSESCRIKGVLQRFTKITKETFKTWFKITPYFLKLSIFSILRTSNAFVNNTRQSVDQPHLEGILLKMSLTNFSTIVGLPGWMFHLVHLFKLMTIIKQMKKILKFESQTTLKLFSSHNQYKLMRHQHRIS